MLFVTMLKKLKNVPLFPLVPFVPLVLAGTLLALNGFILARLRRIAGDVERLSRLESRPSLPA
jgi:hypothetical protein